MLFGLGRSASSHTIGAGVEQSASSALSVRKIFRVAKIAFSHREDEGRTRTHISARHSHKTIPKVTKPLQMVTISSDLLTSAA